ncbi:MAG TPA: DUF1992 domain-containing protein [Candidatus Acidoferrales bacterium]|jgi:hypothetical protein|nr:DUF1992 domain-containing protein [Candidatus Acidoferrales bacterium]
MDIWNLVADRKIREAMEEGAFDRLEGAGQPLDLEENPYLDPALRMAHRLLRNNGFAPSWILEGKDLDGDILRLRASRERCTPEEFRRRAAELNQRILAYNLKVPVSSAQKLPLKD